jgi:xylulokinase
MFADPERLIAERSNGNVFELLTQQAAQIRPGADGLLYLPYMGNTLSPNWNSQAKGVFFGARLSTTRAHMIRALVEGVAYDLYSNVKIAKEAGVKVDELTLNGGPTKSAFWNQITANVTNLPLLVTDVDEAAPLGDAILAAVGAGLYDAPTDPVSELVSIVGTVEPDPAIHEMYEDFFAIWRRVYFNLLDEMNDHHELLYKYNFE